MFLAALGSVFSSFRIWLYVGIAVAGLLLFAYIQTLRQEVAASGGIIQVQSAALATNQQSIDKLTQERQTDQMALGEAYDLADKTQKALTAAEQEIANAPKDDTKCGLSPRDRAAIDGVRRILGAGASDPHH